MSKQEIVRTAMVEAMKSHNKERKDALSLLLAALKNAEINMRRPLTEDEENEVVQKEIKQVKETLSLCPADREDIQSQCEYRIAVYSEFCPRMMNEADITDVIGEVLKDMTLIYPTPKDKGKIMQKLMPKVKGKADGKLVNQVLTNILKEGEV